MTSTPLAAFSLRYVSSSYTGAVVRVRRSSDNAEANFRPSEIEGGTLACWAGTGDGFVTTWFDQSGAGRDVTQSTSTRQPRIVTGGVVESLNGKPALLWTETAPFPADFGQSLERSGVSTRSALSFSAILAPQQTGRYHRIFMIGTDDANTQASALTFAQAAANDWLAGDFFMFGSGVGTGNAPRAISSGPALRSSNATQHYVFGVMSSNDTAVFVNRKEMAYRLRRLGNAFNHSSQGLVIGNRRELGFQGFIGRMQEIVIWTTNESQRRIRIDAEVSNYYGV